MEDLEARKSGEVPDIAGSRRSIEESRRGAEAGGAVVERSKEKSSEGRAETTKAQERSSEPRQAVRGEDVPSVVLGEGWKKGWFWGVIGFVCGGCCFLWLLVAAEIATKLFFETSLEYVVLSEFGREAAMWVVLSAMGVGLAVWGVAVGYVAVVRRALFWRGLLGALLGFLLGALLGFLLGALLGMGVDASQLGGVGGYLGSVGGGAYGLLMQTSYRGVLLCAVASMAVAVVAIALPPIRHRMGPLLSVWGALIVINIAALGGALFAWLMEQVDVWFGSEAKNGG